VIFEIPKIALRTFADGSAKPFESTAAHHRFRLAVPPRTRATTKVREAWPEHRRMEYESVQAGNLDAWLRDRLLDPAAGHALAPIVALWAKAAGLDQKIAELDRARAAAYEGQKQLTTQLGVLKEGGPEGELRLRYARELAQAQDRVNRITSEMESLSRDRDRAKEEAAALRAALVAKAP